MHRPKVRATEIQDHLIYEAKSLSLRGVECELNSSRILGDRTTFPVIERVLASKHHKLFREAQERIKYTGLEKPINLLKFSR